MIGYDWRVIRKNENNLFDEKKNNPAFRTK